MVLKYTISAAPDRLEDVIVRIWEAESDEVGAHVYEETIPERNALDVPTPGAGHQVKRIITVNALDKVVHVVRLIGALSGEIIHEYNEEPKTTIVTTFDPVTFKVGDGGADTPAANQNECITPELAGLADNEFLIHRNNYGFLFPGIHFNITNTATGAWVLIQDSDEFGLNEEFLIQKKPSVVTTVVNDSVVGKWFKGFEDISANTNYDNAHLRKLLRFSGTCSYTFQATDNVPIGYAFFFQHYGEDGVGTINFLNADVIYPGVDRNVIEIPSKCQGCFVFDGDKWNIVLLTDAEWQDVPADESKKISAAGSINVGDVPAGDPKWEIVHNKNLADYTIMVSIRSNVPADYHRNNKLCHTWWKHETDPLNRAWVSLQEISGEVQNISIDWILIKL